MGVPGAQWKASEKAARFCSEPSILWVMEGMSHPAGWCQEVGVGVRGGGHLPVLEGTVDISLNGLDGELRLVGSTPHLWAHGRGCGTGGGGGPWGWVKGEGGPEEIWLGLGQQDGRVVSFLMAQRSPASPTVPSWVGEGAGQLP